MTIGKSRNTLELILKTYWHLILAFQLVLSGVLNITTDQSASFVVETSSYEIEEPIEESFDKNKFCLAKSSESLGLFLPIGYQSIHYQVRKLHFSPDCPEQFYYELMDEGA